MGRQNTRFSTGQKLTPSTVPPRHRTPQRVVNEVSVPMWMPGQCSGATPLVVRGPDRPRAGAMVSGAPRVEVYNTEYGNITQVVAPPTIHATVHALG